MNIMRHSFLSHHAHLLIGTVNTTHQKIISELQHILCPCTKNTFCTVCTQIMEKQHHAILWVEPEYNYTLEQINEILESTRFKRDTKNPFFIIFQQAQQLSIACNNRLLKTIEEPHEGYYFIFSATRTDTLLTTLISRCFVQQFNHVDWSEKYQEFMSLCMNFSHLHAQTFLKMIDTLAIKEQESKDIIDLLIQKYYVQLKQLHQEPNHNPNHLLQTLHIMTILSQALEQLPAAGSSKIFWKNIALSLFECGKRID